MNSFATNLQSDEFAADYEAAAEMREREDLYSAISDLSKDVQGFRVRFDYMTMPLEQLRLEWVYWCAESDRRSEEYLDELYMDAQAPVYEDPLVDEWEEVYNSFGL